MKLNYDDQDDILSIEFSNDPIVRDVSHDWNVNIGYSANGIAEITILDAAANGYWPPNAKLQFLTDTVERLHNAKHFMTDQEWQSFADYDGPIVSGNPEGRLPKNFPDDDE